MCETQDYLWLWTSPDLCDIAILDCQSLTGGHPPGKPYLKDTSLKKLKSSLLLIETLCFDISNPEISNITNGTIKEMASFRYRSYKAIANLEGTLTERS